MEAGVEHLSRSTTRSSDVMLIVAEPYFKSLETAARVRNMAIELGIPKVFAVANKVRTPMEHQAIQTFSEKNSLDILAIIPYDESIAEASLIPASPVDHAPDSVGVQAIEGLARKLTSNGWNGR
jgi:CO dehydrogenase maturation factor